MMRFYLLVLKSKAPVVRIYSNFTILLERKKKLFNFSLINIEDGGLL
jgi:hypothetical protein